MRARRIPWARFTADAQPVIQVYYDQHHKSPTMTKLRQLGAGWIVSAAYHYYGGYPAMLRRLGFPRATRPMIQRPGHRRQGYWLVEENIKRELQMAFPELLAWEIMPSLHMIQRALPGLGSRILRVDSVVELAVVLGLQSYWIGCRHRRRVAGISWSLTFYEGHNRWPHAAECPSAVRTGRFVRGTSWHDYCRPAKLPRPALLRLIDRFQQHRSWLLSHRSDKVLTRQRVLNHHIIDLHKRFPPFS